MGLIPAAGSCRRWLAATSATALLLAWLLGELAKQFVQPGLSNDSERQALLIDYIVIGALVFGLTMVLTVAISCWVRKVMQGPERRADDYPLPIREDERNS